MNERSEKVTPSWVKWPTNNDFRKQDDNLYPLSQETARVKAAHYVNMINIAYSETKFLHCPKLCSKDMYICLNNKYNDSAESESILYFEGYGGWKFPRWSEYKKIGLYQNHLLVYLGQLFITDSTCYKLNHN